eukprot:8698258-Pyramimonas_sp.AAC.1
MREWRRGGVGEEPLLGAAPANLIASPPRAIPSPCPRSGRSARRSASRGHGTHRSASAAKWRPRHRATDSEGTWQTCATRSLAPASGRPPWRAPPSTGARPRGPSGTPPLHRASSNHRAACS